MGGKMKPALLVETVADGLRCLLCAHHCRLKDGQTGICGVRKNSGGQLAALSYDKVAATHSDPIEKKPLYHFLPGSISFSIATMGCNFKCKFCQNNSLSVVPENGRLYGQDIAPEELVRTALHYGSRSIAYTYTEPTIYFELMLETAKLAAAEGIKNVMVTNGYMSGEALEMMSPYLHGANVDLKSFSDDFYRKMCGARLQYVLETIESMKEKDVWIELTTLLIPGLNDDPAEIKELISFIVDLDNEIPWHVSRFYPQHNLTDKPPTNPQEIFNYLEIARDMGLKYLYAGNVLSDRWENTVCPECDSLLIERSGYSTRVRGLTAGACGSCGTPIAGVWE
jgi:pyruvate formate lyase activating enzyme